MNKNVLLNVMEINLLNNGSEIVRRNRKMKEKGNVSFCFLKDEFCFLNEYREKEYSQYLEMIKPQFPRFNKYLNLDKYSRRLLIQFPADWYEDKEEDYMPCPESFLVQFIDENSYKVLCNFRSSEISRILEDVAIIKKFCEYELNLNKYNLQYIDVNFMNVHKYLDGGSSEDFTAKTYFETKEK